MWNTLWYFTLHTYQVYSLTQLVISWSCYSLILHFSDPQVSSKSTQCIYSHIHYNLKMKIILKQNNESSRNDINVFCFSINWSENSFFPIRILCLFVCRYLVFKIQVQSRRSLYLLPFHLYFYHYLLHQHNFEKLQFISARSGRNC